MANKSTKKPHDLTVAEEFETYENMNTVLSSLSLGIGTFKITKDKTIPLSASDSLAVMLGYDTQNKADIDPAAVLPGQLYLDRQNLKNEIDKGHPVEFIARLSRRDGSSFVGRVSIAPRHGLDHVYDVTVMDVEHHIIVESEPKIKKVLTGLGSDTVINHCIRAWHDKRYRLILEDMSVINFEYDCETDIYTYYTFNEDGKMNTHESLHFIKNVKLHKKTKLDPKIVISQQFETMMDRPVLREFDVHNYIEDKGYRWYACKCKSVADNTGRVRKIVGRFDDVTTKQNEHAKLHDLAEKDGLTGILNRAAMERFFENYFTKPVNSRSGILFFIDFDKFKFINDTYGHLSGDELLKESAKAISHVLRKEDMFARYGGDEFVAFIDKMTDVDKAVYKAKQIIKAVSSVRINGNIQVKCSLGFTALWEEDKNANQAIKRADTALLQAKRYADGSFVYYGRQGCGEAIVVQNTEIKDI